MTVTVIAECDRCDKRCETDAKRVNLGLAHWADGHYHLCASCVTAFERWIADANPKRKAAA